MKAQDCLEWIKNEVKLARLAHNKMQIEANCLYKEIERLEDLAFKIENQIDKEGEE